MSRGSDFSSMGAGTSTGSAHQWAVIVQNPGQLGAHGLTSRVVQKWQATVLSG